MSETATHVEIDWSSARVDGATLVVELSPAPPKWRKRATSVVAALQRPGQPWDDVAVKKDRVVVTGVAEGAEADVRHFLESVVLQANGGERASEPRPDDADARMTAAFQAFGEALSPE